MVIIFTIMQEFTNIRVSKKLKQELAKFGKFGETYEDVIWKLIKIAKEKKVKR